MEMDLSFPRVDDEDLILPQAEAFPSMAPQGTGALRSSAVPQDESSSEESAVAPQRKRREPKTLPYDQIQELRNSTLAQWNAEYLTNMEEARKKKIQRKNASSTKQNAALWVFGAGIGGVGIGRGGSNMQGPLAETFSGDALMTALTGFPTSAAGRKRGRSENEGDESDAEERRVRMREDEEEIGRAQGPVLDDDDALVLPGSEVSSSISRSPIQLIDLPLSRPSNYPVTAPKPSTIPLNFPGTEAPPYETHALDKVP